MDCRATRIRPCRSSYLSGPALFGTLLTILATSAAFARDAVPGWVLDGGVSPQQYPDDRYLTGFSMVEDPGANLVAAKNAAASDLASRVMIRIESKTSRVVRESKDVQIFDVSVCTQVTTDVRLPGMLFLSYSNGGRFYAMAVLERAKAALHHGRERDRYISEAQTLMTRASRSEAAGREADAIRSYQRVTVAALEALNNDAIARAVAGPIEPSPGFRAQSLDAARALDKTLRESGNRIEALMHGSVSSLDQAADLLAMQLHQQGIPLHGRLEVPPFFYGSTPFSSPYGKQAALRLEAAMGRKLVSGGKTKSSGPVVLRGTYVQESDGGIGMLVIARAAKDGAMLGSGQVRLSVKGLPAGLSLKPSNFDQALKDQGLLGDGELVSGKLRIEAWTDRGRRNLVLTAGDEVRLFLRVNRPAKYRILYHLATGERVLLDEGFYVDRSKVNLAVEHPDSFEVVPPFGVERIQIVACTLELDALSTRKALVQGEEYDVVGLGDIIRTRGLRKKKNKDNECAEALITLTTMAQ